ncbi:MAG: ATP-binding cassette domain-containing protein [Candidatus Rokubacteria bacterium]|nr:ATP-binding cassette domain-containing protein [Candidatus Rokubacteria bacterium]
MRDRAPRGRWTAPGTIPSAALLAGLLVALSLAPRYWIASDYQVDIARLALYAACLTATWSLLAGVAGQFSFGHVAIAGVAAYAGAIWGREVSAHTPLLGTIWASLAIGALSAMVLGTTLGLVVLRLRGAYLALFTLAFGEIARLVIIAEKDVTGGRLSLAIAQLPGDGRDHYHVVFGTVLAVFAVIYWVIGSRVGLFLRALREDADAASAMAVDVTRLKVFVFSLTSLLVGLAASVYYHTTPRLTPEILDLLEMGFLVVYAVVGGLESPLSGALAAVILVVTLEALRVINLGPLRLEPGVWRFAVFGALLVVTLRVAPNGFIAPLVAFLAGAPRPGRPPTAPRSEPGEEAQDPGGRPITPSAVAPAPPLPPRRLARPIDLRVEGVKMHFGGAVALDGVTFSIDRPQICGLIGPNGAGKTTLANVVSGYYRPTGGAVILGGERVDGLPPHDIVRRGLGRTFQITRAWRRLTVLENLLVPELAMNPAERRDAAERRARTALDTVNLGHLAAEYARALSGGQQKLLELARLLMLDTEILVLDEPFAGVHPVLKRSIADLVRRLLQDGRAVVLIEHDLTTVFSLCDRLIVLDCGLVVADGEPDAVRRDSRVIAAYLGGREADRPGRAATPSPPG